MFSLILTIVRWLNFFSLREWSCSNLRFMCFDSFANWLHICPNHISLYFVVSVPIQFFPPLMRKTKSYVRVIYCIYIYVSLFLEYVIFFLKKYVNEEMYWVLPLKCLENLWKWFCMAVEKRNRFYDSCIILWILRWTMHMYRALKDCVLTECRSTV